MSRSSKITHSKWGRQCRTFNCRMRLEYLSEASPPSHGPFLIRFDRGSWCPYYSVALQAL